MDKAPIGVFDSGVGGLTVLRELRLRLPQEDFLYVADQAHAPYGSRERTEVRRFGFGIAEFLLAHGAKLIVVACNTISAVALQPLRAAYPAVPFVGMEPAVKPAAEESANGIIGVIATEATFQGELFAGVVNRYGRGVQVITRTVPGLVERIEAGQVEGPELETLLRGRLQPLMDAGVDELVLGCTHYPFVLRALQKVVGPDVRIIDPSPAVARQTEQVLADRKLPAAGGAGTVAAYTSGDPEALRRFIRNTLGEEFSVRGMEWTGGDAELKLMEKQSKR
ncbi:MAG: glutamate racemase [Anaerolineales bacterium]